MALTAEALRELHRIHRQLTDLRDRLERSPKQIRARHAHVTGLDAELKKAQEEVKAARMAADRKNVDLKAGETKIRELQNKLNECSTNREYQALMDQIAASKMAGSVLSDEILETLERIDQLEAKVAEARKILQGGQEELAKLEQQVAAAASGIQADVARLDAELKTNESALPDDFRVDYQRVVKAKGEDALASVEGSFCGGCNQSITANQQNDLYLERVVFCKTCGRLLYLPSGQTRAERGK